MPGARRSVARLRQRARLATLEGSGVEQTGAGTAQQGEGLVGAPGALTQASSVGAGVRAWPPDTLRPPAVNTGRFEEERAHGRRLRCRGLGFVEWPEPRKTIPR